MKQYLDLLRHVLENGERKTDPQGVGNIAVCGYQMRFNMKDGFPLITTRSLKGSWKAIIHELLWFLSGSTKIEALNKYGVRLWDQWATPEICEKMNLPVGDLGPIYGKQWRAFDGGGTETIDQIQRVVSDIKCNPDSRRLIVTSWNPCEADMVFVAPCHCFFQFFHSNGKLSLHLFQRSADIPVGVPFNIAEYSLLLMMVAQVTGLEAWEFVHTLSDAHIYLNQIEAVKEQLSREPRVLPNAIINPNIDDIFSFEFFDFELEGYDPYPPIKIPVAL